MDSQNDISNTGNTPKKKILPDYTYDDISNKDVLDLLGAQNMPDEQKKEIYRVMIETIESRVIARIDDELSDDDAAKLKEILDKKDKEGFDAFMIEKGIDVTQIYTQETLAYKVELIDLMKSEE
jgi:hypothetical protein